MVNVEIRRPQVDIVQSDLSHVRELSKSLRDGDQIEAISLGLAPHKALYYSYKQGLYRRTGLVDGKVAAMWGVAGTLLGLVGQPYLATGREVEKISPIRFARIYKKQTHIINQIFPILENYVDASYLGAVGMLRLAGFELSEPIQMLNGTFCRFSRKMEE